MSNLFGNISGDPRIERQALVNKFNAARSNLLLLVIFSVVNIFLLATGSGMYFLFSASVPYLITYLGMFLCGMFPNEFYEGLEGMFFLDKSFFVIMLIISLLILLIYLLCWWFSKKKGVGWLIGATVMFGIDTLVMFLSSGISSESIFDVIFHIWVIVILIMGISAYYKLKKMPEERRTIEGEFTDITENGEGGEGGAIQGEHAFVPDSIPLRPVDNNVKAKILLEAEIYGHFITYRRAKKTNELVIDGNVYAEYTALAELPHMLTATIGGHTFAAGCDNTSHSYILVDGKTVKTKFRLI